MTEVINETDYEINEAEFSALADFVLDQMHVSSDAEVNIIFIEPELPHGRAAPRHGGSPHAPRHAR